MKSIFEEYGSVIIAVIVGVLLFALIFGGIQLYKVIGDGVDVETTFNHSESEKVVKQVSERTAPDISVSDTTKLHLYADQVFKPISTISCVDADGAAVEVSVSKILFINSNGVQSNITTSYDAETDELDLSTAVNETGVLSVTFQAVDNYKVKAIKSISYVVDAVSR